MVAIAPLVLASSPGYTQTSSPAESPTTLIPVSPKDLPVRDGATPDGVQKTPDAEIYVNRHT